MKIEYTRAALYMYPQLDNLILLNDMVANKRALASMYNYGSAEEQCIKVAERMIQKQTLMDLKDMLEAVMAKCTPVQLKFLEEKCFGTPKEVGKFKHSGRKVVRQLTQKQELFLHKFGRYLEFFGGSDKWFETEAWRVDQIRGCAKRILKYEAPEKRTRRSKEECLLSK